MVWNWGTILTVQVIIWLMIVVEWKKLKKAPKANKITFGTILVLISIMSFFNLESLPGPITFLHYIFGPLGRWMGMDIPESNSM